MKTISIHLVAPNDASGNPRRLFVYVDECGVIIGARDEGYLGKDAGRVIRRGDLICPATPMSFGINITVKEYNRLKRVLPVDSRS